MLKASLFSRCKDFIAKHYGENPGKMLIHTGVVGWILSSVAQVAAIVINDKIPKEQKMFLIPQEMADAGVNIASFYLITQSFKSVAAKLVKTGKLLPGNVRKILAESKLADSIGKNTFNIARDAHLPKDLAQNYKSFEDGVDVVATTIGSILSCNIVTPIVRNEIAAKRQKSGIAKMNSNLSAIGETSFTHKTSMGEFQTLSTMKYSNGKTSLKI